MKQIFSFYSNKGGVGKTTIAYNLAELIGLMGVKVLVIDNDPQSNISTALGCNKNNLSISYLYSCELSVEQIISQCIENTRFLNVGCIPCNDSINTKDLKAEPKILRELINKSDYDLMIIDNPPGFTSQLRFSINVSNSWIFPTILKKFSIEGLKELLEIFNDLGIEKLNIYVIPNLVKTTKNLKIKRKVDLEYLNQIIAIFKGFCFDHYFPEDPAIEETLNNDKSIFLNRFKTSLSIKAYIRLLNILFEGIEIDEVYNRLKTLSRENRVEQIKKRLGLYERK